MSMAFTLPLAKASKTLAPIRPTSSLLGLQTMASSIGILLLNFSFMMIGILALMSQSWYQCRKWNSIDVSNATVIGDNYEASVIFLITGYQYISTAMAYNFGYSFRSHWMKNKYFAILSFLFTALHVHITLVPGKFSCFFRVNCSNEVRVKTSSLSKLFKSLLRSLPFTCYVPGKGCTTIHHRARPRTYYESLQYNRDAISVSLYFDSNNFCQYGLSSVF